MSANKPVLQLIYERLAPFILLYRDRRQDAANELIEARAQVPLLEQIAWQTGPAQTVDRVLRLHDPRGYATRRNIDKLMEGTFWYLLIVWLVAAIPLAATDRIPQGIGIAVLSTSGALMVAAQIVLLFGGLAKEMKWARVDSSVVACVSCSLVLRRALEVAQDPINTEARRELADRVEQAAKSLSPRRFIAPGLKSRATKKRAQAKIKRASDVLASYGDTALCGGPKELLAMADDFGRAALRIASGNWHQIADLRPEQPPNQHRGLSPFLREIMLNVIKVAVPALIAAAVALISTTGSALAG